MHSIGAAESCKAICTGGMDCNKSETSSPRVPVRRLRIESSMPRVAQSAAVSRNASVERGRVSTKDIPTPQTKVNRGRTSSCLVGSVKVERSKREQKEPRSAERRKGNEVATALRDFRDKRTGAEESPSQNANRLFHRELLSRTSRALCVSTETGTHAFGISCSFLKSRMIFRVAGTRPERIERNQ